MAGEKGELLVVDGEPSIREIFAPAARRAARDARVHRHGIARPVRRELRQAAGCHFEPVRKPAEAGQIRMLVARVLGAAGAS